MANIGFWLDALKKIQSVQCRDLKTTQVYSKIKEFGFNTVVWKEFEISAPTEKNANALLEETKRFISKNKPRLFIFDPKEKTAKKGFLFGVESNKEVKKWVKKNLPRLCDYSYLVTSQIVNDGDGFVGSVYSDGCGKIFCETLHIPMVSNHRMLSQPKGDISRYLDFFTAQNFELESAAAKFLKQENIQQIMKEFLQKKGYFEFVCGSHLGKKGIFVTGFEENVPFEFPHSLHESSSFDVQVRCKAAALKNT